MRSKLFFFTFIVKIGIRLLILCAVALVVSDKSKYLKPVKSPSAQTSEIDKFFGDPGKIRLVKVEAPPTYSIYKMVQTPTSTESWRMEPLETRVYTPEEKLNEQWKKEYDAFEANFYYNINIFFSKFYALYYVAS